MERKKCKIVSYPFRLYFSRQNGFLSLPEISLFLFQFVEKENCSNFVELLLYAQKIIS